jgi:hypothetical protein
MPALPTRHLGRRVLVSPRFESTDTLALSMASDPIQDWLALLADEQTAPALPLAAVFCVGLNVAAGQCVPVGGPTACGLMATFDEDYERLLHKNSPHLNHHGSDGSGCLAGSLQRTPPDLCG